MQYSQDGLHLTELFESCRLTAYQDVKGVWTIGWGHTGGVQQGDTCTQDQADQWLMDDVQSAVTTVNSMVHVTLTQGEFDAVVDLVFNIGSGNFSGSTMLRKLNRNDLVGAANEFERWDQSGGQVVAGLLRRRKAEESIFNGTFNGDANG
jgi:lysozyme